MYKRVSDEVRYWLFQKIKSNIKLCGQRQDDSGYAGDFYCFLFGVVGGIRYLSLH